jgi:hypothetical protein
MWNFSKRNVDFVKFPSPLKVDEVVLVIEQRVLIAVTLACAVLLYTPLLTTNGEDLSYLNHSTFGKAVLHSNHVYVANACLTSSSAPFLMDVILDFPAIIERARRLGFGSVRGVFVRTFFLASMIIPSCIYVVLLQYEDKSRLPLIYCAMVNTLLLLAGWGFFAALSSLRIIPGFLLLTCALSLDISCVIKIRGLLKPNNAMLHKIGICLSAVFLSTYVSILFSWVYKFYRRSSMAARSNTIFEPNRAEILCALYG